MTTKSGNTSPVAYARVAGLLYLIIISCGISSEVFVRSGLIVWGSAGTTAGHILASPGLFRAGFAADSTMLLADVAVAVIFYVLFKPVSSLLSLMAAAFRLMQAAILGANLLNYYAALLILNGTGSMTAFDAGQGDSLALLFLDLHRHGYDLALLFFGVSNLVLGYLVVRSGFCPKIIGWGLMAAALVYVSGSGVRFFSPDCVSLIEPAYLVPFIAELSFCLWLLVKGVRIRE